MKEVKVSRVPWVALAFWPDMVLVLLSTDLLLLPWQWWPSLGNLLIFTGCPHLYVKHRGQHHQHRNQSAAPARDHILENAIKSRLQLCYRLPGHGRWGRADPSLWSPAASHPIDFSARQPVGLCHWWSSWDKYSFRYPFFIIPGLMKVFL